MAGPYTVTATLNDPGNNALQGNAFVRFRLRNFQGFVPQVSGTAILAETQIDALPNGSGLISQVLWGNSDITPSTTYYTVEWWNAGRRTSAGNYIFDANTNLNTASPVVTVPTPPGVSPLVLENNGTLNSSQTTLNLESTDGSVVITDEGAGTLNLHTVAPSPVIAAGQNIVLGRNCATAAQGGQGASTSTFLGGGTAYWVLSGRSLVILPGKFTITMNVSSGTPQILHMNITKVVMDSAGTVVGSPVPISFGGDFTPTLATGLNTSDTITFTFDATHDYYFRMFTNGSGDFYLADVVTAAAFDPFSYSNSADATDHTADTPITCGTTISTGTPFFHFLSA